MDFEEHFHPDDPDHVFVAFAAGSQLQFQWGRTLSRLRRSHVLVRCSRQNHYQTGIDGVGDLLASLRYVADLRPRRITALGVSIGAYAALLYGQFARIDDVLIFSPLTGRDTDDFPSEFHDQIRAAQEDPLIDLRRFFRDGPLPRVRAFVSDGESTELDRHMCERINVTDVTLVPGYKHRDLARGMRDTGLLDELLLA